MGERKKEKEEKKQQTSGTIVYCSTACYYEGHRDGPRVHWFLSVHCPPPFTYYDFSLKKKHLHHTQPHLKNQRTSACSFELCCYLLECWLHGCYLLARSRLPPCSPVPSQVRAMAQARCTKSRFEQKKIKNNILTSYLTMLTILYYTLASLIGEQDFKPVWVVFLKVAVYNWNSLFFFYNSLVMFSASSGSRRAISAIAPASFAFGISSTVL